MDEPGFLWIAGWFAWQNKKFLVDHEIKMMKMEGGGKIKTVAVSVFIIINVLGIVALVSPQ